ncbi:polysaccharide deacetylase family protein [Acidocella sp. KAb 2-4]|uniref:polysaccharide deacetylase family protein n=1 Tax=Acidocella sp. KAb 2-4 TaxID=2885158 RepID=UPI001D07E6E5|nr:polysaccharide deacetylase family protein [Acidocella sp. KAb 2-4]MCB5944730.1 polysaccharide deacetylase family protein [Acidocella sp. KAb 2-4]
MPSIFGLRAVAAGLFCLLAGAAIAAPPVPILVYHRFDPSQSGLTTVTTASFTQQLDWLAAHHYQIIPLAQLAQWRDIPSPAVAITVDDGHESVFTQLYPILRQRHIHVTLFVYPSAISRASYALTWPQLAEMVNSGLVDVQAHTYWHPDFRKEKAARSPADYRAFVDMQLVKSKTVLEQRLGISVTMLAWPYGIHDPMLEDAARRAGYTAAFAFAGGQAQPGDDPLAIPRIPVSGWVTLAQFTRLVSP